MSKTRVFFDVSALPEVGKAVTGISRVVLSVLRHMANDHPDMDVQGISFRDADEPYRLWSLAEIAEQAGDLLDLAVSPATEAVMPQRGDCLLLLGEQWLFPASIPTAQQLKQERGVKVVSLVHDLVPFFMPELYWDGFPEAYISCINSLVAVSDGILVYSENTRKDLLKYFPALAKGPRPVARMRLGDRFDFAGNPPQQPVLPNEVSTGKFILCVGTIQPRKNQLLLLSVWRQLCEVYGDACPPLLLVGKPGWHVDELMYFFSRNRALKKNVHVLEQVSDAELQWLYKHCLFSVYPSLYEGWGLPIAESLAAGRLCLASSTSAMPEVAGELIDYFSPHDSGELFRLIDHYFSNPAQRERKEQTIRERFVPTSWSDATDQVVAAIKGASPPADDSAP
jgi:glycosyltransferase involved in cell wall biosynthesis